MFISYLTSAQNSYLKIYGISEFEDRTIDSIGYNKKHSNVKAVFEEVQLVSNKLMKQGYIDAQLPLNTKANDSTFLFQIQLGKRTNFIHIYIGRNSSLKSLTNFESKSDTLIMKIGETESFLNETLGKLETNGYSLSKLKIVNFKKIKNSLFAELVLETGNRRQLNDIVINGSDKFPEGHKKEMVRLHKNKTFNQENLKKIYSDFEKFRFVNQTKYPEILFKKDTTKVYVYLEKSKPNKFDGFIGFSNDEKSKLIFNGYLDLLLVNIMNAGEEFSLYWKSDGGNQKTFNLGLEVPYIFKSPIGIKASLNIFKQDSIFQNTRTTIDLGYFFNYNSRLYLGYQSAESSDIQNKNSAIISDYKNSFVTTNYEFVAYQNSDFLFPEKSKISSKIGFGSRNSNLKSYQQFFTTIDVSHSLFLNEKNCINIKSRNYYLQSDQYIVNELYRFGGINSIRGFNENSLQANLFSSLLTEYRYVLAPSIYIHSIIDYGYFKDTINTKSGTLLGLGFGFGLLTKNGLFNIIYANGSMKDQAIKLSNSIVHISFKSQF
ncbi:MAG: hypothetical protein EXR18_05935 [Flavobacteriaceae bacterium]|nr:hypothetical protein [Flavobacteriaceae bacterium]